MSESADITILGGGPVLAGHLVRPSNARRRAPGVVLIHGFPSMARPGPPNQSYRLLAERVSQELGWSALAVSLRGCGGSEGDFSLSGWISDVHRAIEHLDTPATCLLGSTTGGSLAILAADGHPAVVGVASIAARADFDDWASEPDGILEHARRVKAIRTADYPSSVVDWAADIGAHRPVEAAARQSDTPFLVVHGAVDRQVPARDSREIAAAHGNADLRILDGADHRVRHDPRCVALLLGWLDRQAD